MIFSLIILVLIGVIAFFHYVQGVFSATLSAILTVIAAMVAVSYAEPLVDQFFASGKFADYALSAMLVVLFALVYLILRLIFDSLIPGNVQLPVIADKIGAAVMGVIAGIFATGVFAIAAEAMPFGASFGMHALYEVETKATVVRGERNRSYDATVYDETKVMTLEETNKRGSTWIPVGDMVLSLAQHLSDGGSLAGKRQLASLHPDWLQELFGQRVGLEVGAKHVALPDDIASVEIFTMDRVPQVSGVPPRVRQFTHSELRREPDEFIMVVRMKFNPDAAGDGNILRISTGAVRLRGMGGTAADPRWVNYYPRGTYENGRLYVNKPSDPIFISAGNGADFVFLVKSADVFQQSGDNGMVVKNNVFVEAKRLGRVDLGGKQVRHATPPADDSIRVLRTDEVREAATQPQRQQGNEGGSND